MLLSSCKSGGNKTGGQVEITGIITDKEDGSILKDAVITNSRTETSALSDENGRFSMLCQKGDTLAISYAGLITQNIPVNPSDSTKWKISMLAYGPIIEPVLQKSYSTNDGLKMTVVNPDLLKVPVDSIVVKMWNNSDKEAMFGEWYRLERLDGDKWLEVLSNASLENQNGERLAIVFSAVGYILPPHESRKYANHTSMYNENITSGRYRLIKTFRYPPYPNEKSDTAYVEFEIP